MLNKTSVSGWVGLVTLQYFAGGFRYAGGHDNRRRVSCNLTRRLRAPVVG